MTHESRGTYRGMEVRLSAFLSNADDRRVVRVFLRRSPGSWEVCGDKYYRANCFDVLVSERGGRWPPGSWERIGEVLEMCHAFVSKPFTAQEAGFA